MQQLFNVYLMAKIYGYFKVNVHLWSPKNLKYDIQPRNLPPN